MQDKVLPLDPLLEVFCFEWTSTKLREAVGNGLDRIHEVVFYFLSTGIEPHASNSQNNKEEKERMRRGRVNKEGQRDSRTCLKDRANGINSFVYFSTLSHHL